MEARVFGTESEYALLYAEPHGREVCRLDEEAFFDRQKKLAALLVQTLSRSGHLCAGEFLGNGGRFYIDRGGHPEYATPECRRVRDLVCHEKAGDLFVQNLVQAAQATLTEAGQTGRLAVLKNNVDAWGHSYGAHENYLVAPSVLAHLHHLIPFLVSRQIITGAGWVVPQPQGQPPFHLWQRAAFIDQVFSDRTSGVRGIINTRKREIPRVGQNVRLHLILGDANLAEPALWLKIGTTALVLRLLEEEGPGDLPCLADPVQALRQVSRDWHTPLALEGSSRRLTAWELQATYWERAQRFYQSRVADPEDLFTLDLWRQTLADLARLQFNPTAGLLEDDPGDLKYRLDWVLKLWLLNRAQAAHRFAWQDQRSQLLGRLYHDLDPDTGLFQHCAKLQLTARLVNPADIHRALQEPPTDTRARLRGLIIRQSQGRAVQVTIKDWEKIQLLALWPNRRPLHAFDRTRRLVRSLTVHLEEPCQAEDAAILTKVCAFLENC